MKKIFINLLFTLIVHSIFGQDTIYYDNEWNETQSFKTAFFFKTINTSRNRENEIVEKVYYKSGQIKSEIFYFLDINEKKNRTGKSSFWYETGVLKTEISYKNGKKDGEFISYWENGKLKRKDNFKKGKFKNGECWNEFGEKIKHYDYEILPKYPGAKTKMYEFIKKNLKYPTLSKKHNLGGKVIIVFIIDETGKVTNAKIKQSVNEEIDNEALRIINKMPRWKPGFHDGIAVSVKYSIPIVFNP